MSSRKWKWRARQLFQPAGWSIRARRVNLALFPVAVPMWLVAVVGSVGIAQTLAAREALRRVWNAPPKPPRSGAGYYSYGRTRRRKSGD